MWTSAFRSMGTRLGTARPASGNGRNDIASGASVAAGFATAVGVVVACLLGAPAWVVAEESPSATSEAVPAVWTPKELNFVYQGFTTKYSCDGLRDKIRGVLLDLGARKKDLQVGQSGCSSSSGKPDPFPGVRVKMSVLEPAGAAVDKPEVARWKPVDLKLAGSSFATDSGECELVEQIRNKIVPLFTSRNVELSTNCVPHQASASRPVLKLEVLAADQKDDKATSRAH